MKQGRQESPQKRLDDLKFLAIRWMQDVWQNGSEEAVDFLHAPNFRDHSPGGYSPDNAGFEAGGRALYKGFPDFCALHNELIIDPAADKVVVRWEASGTHRGPFMCAAATADASPLWRHRHPAHRTRAHQRALARMGSHRPAGSVGAEMSSVMENRKVTRQERKAES
jgi:hypothetical protein